MGIFLSIVVPVYQVGAFLAPCLSALLAQEGDVPYEVILVDDGSTDDSLAIAKAYRAKRPDVFRLIVQANQGCGPARNAGMAMARGEFIAFVDGDDIPLPNYVSAFKRGADAYPNASVIVASYAYLSPKGKLKKAKKPKPGLMDGKTFAASLLNGKVRAFAWNKAIRRDFASAHGILYDQSKVLFEDLPFFVKAGTQAREVAVLGDVVYAYRYARPSSITHGGANDRRLLGHLKAYGLAKDWLIRSEGIEPGYAMLKSAKWHIRGELWVDALLSGKGRLKKILLAEKGLKGLLSEG